MSIVVEETNEVYGLKKGKTYNLEKLRGRWPLKNNIITIGRDASNDIILPATCNYVPREGCEFLKTKEGEWIYLDETRHAKGLKSGDLINIGGVVLRFEEKIKQV